MMQIRSNGLANYSSSSRPTAIGRIESQILKKVTVKHLNIRTPEKIAVITLRFEQHRIMHPKDGDGMVNSVDPDQTVPEQSDLGLHCLPRPVCPKT